MQFQLTRYEYVKTVEFKTDIPIQDVEIIRYFEEHGLSGEIIKKEYRYSWDGITWTNWNTLSQTNLASIQFRDQQDFYLHVKYHRKGIGSGNILGWYLYYDSITPPGPTPTPDSSIDATTFGGELPEYYLNRENHFGSFEDLVVNNFSNLSDASIFLNRIDGSSGTTLTFRTLKGSDGITVRNIGGEIVIDASSLNGDLTNWLKSLDASVLILRNDISTLFWQDASLDARLTSLENQISSSIDASIDILRQDISILESSIVRIDSSINDLINYDLIQDASIEEINDIKLPIITDWIGDVQDDLTDAEASIAYLGNKSDSSFEEIGILKNEQLSQDASIEGLREDIISSDSSIDELRSNILISDASIIDLRNYDLIQDISISNLYDKDSSLSSEISQIKNDISILDSSIEDLRNYDLVQDSSIEELRSDINALDPSLIGIGGRLDSIDASVLRIDASIIGIDSSLQDLYNKDVSIESEISNIKIDISALKNYDYLQDASILDLVYKSNIFDSSIGFLTQWNISQDSSIAILEGATSTLFGDVSILDASVIELRNRILILESSTGELTIWNESQDSSIIELRSKFIPVDSSIIRIDGSLNALFSTDLILESSILYNYGWNISQDASIIRIDSILQIHDSSIGNLYNWQNLQDSSITELRNRLDLTDSSIERIDSSISDIYTVLNSLDASIVNLQNIEILNIGGGIGLYAGKDSSSNDLLKSLHTRGPVTLIGNDGSILIDSSTVKIYDTSISNDSQEMYVNVGGLRKGTTVGELRDGNYTEILNKILFPVLEPSVYSPYVVSFSSNAQPLYEVDANIEITFQTVFSRGTIEINDVFQNDYSGIPIQYHYRGEGLNINRPATSNIDVYPDVPIDLSIGLTNWRVWVSYQSGNQPLDSYGQPSGSPLPAGISSTVYHFDVEAVYPLFATSDQIEDPSTKQDLISMVYGNDVEIELAPETDGYKQSFDLPQPWVGGPINRPLKGIETKNPVSNAWIYQGGDSSTSLESWDIEVVSHIIQGNNVFYNRYKYNGDDRGESLIRLKF
jgi:hypothetical protein